MGKKSLLLLLLIALYLFAFGFTAEEKALEGGEAEISVNSKIIKVPDSCPSHTYIKVYKKQRILELYVDNKLSGSFRIALGQSPEGDKSREGDSKTPEGQYFICTRNESSNFTLFLGLNYPNTEDAERGLENKIISREVYEQIKAAEECHRRPPWNTPMGGEIGIHGGGSTHDWTQGCIALSDEDIILIGKYVSINTPVQIFE